MSWDCGIRESRCARRYMTAPPNAGDVSLSPHIGWRGRLGPGWNAISAATRPWWESACSHVPQSWATQIAMTKVTPDDRGDNLNRVDAAGFDLYGIVGEDGKVG